jgi:hypothetical protein
VIRLPYFALRLTALELLANLLYLLKFSGADLLTPGMQVLVKPTQTAKLLTLIAFDLPRE